MTDKINPTKSLIESAKQVSSKLSDELNKLKSDDTSASEFEQTLQDLDNLDHDVEVMLKRIEILIKLNTTASTVI